MEAWPGSGVKVDGYGMVMAESDWYPLKRKNATGNGLSTPHDQNRDGDLENVPALRFRVELANQQ